MGAVSGIYAGSSSLHWQLWKSNVLISGSITHKFLKFLHLDYHSSIHNSTNFQYHSRSFDIRNTS